jgi:hypothetical protein
VSSLSVTGTGKGPLYGGFQSPACCVLMEEDVCAFLEVAVHECSRGDMACRRDWSQAELGDQVRWIHRAGCRSQ